MTAETIPAPRYTSHYKGLVLGLLLAAFTVNFNDRTIISIIGPAIPKAGADLVLDLPRMGR